MTIAEIINNRRTIHSFLNEDISPELVREGLELALTAPNHRHTFPWKFVEIGKKTRLQLIDIALSTIALKKGESSNHEELEARRAKLQIKLQYPASIIAFVMKKSDDPFVEREDYASVACGIQNFTLFMKSHSWDAKWSTGAISTHIKTYELLSIDSNTDEIVGFVMVGHSAARLSERRRPDLDEVFKKLP